MTRHFAVQFGSDDEGWAQSKKYPLAYDSVNHALDALQEPDCIEEAPYQVPPSYRIVRVTVGAAGIFDNVEPVTVYDSRLVFLVPADGDHTAINEALSALRGPGPLVGGSTVRVI